MYIKKLTIKNFKAISDMKLEFQPGVNLLIGDNGVGKTTILEAASIALGGFLSGITGVSAKNILQTDIRIGKKSVGGASTRLEYHLPTKIGCTVQMPEGDLEWSRERTSEEGNQKTKLDNRQISKYAQNLANDSNSVLPVLCFQSEARIWHTRRGDFGKELKKKLDDRRCGYIGCLDDSLDIKGIQAWCLKMEMAEYKQQTKIPEYEMFKEVVSTFMQVMNETKQKPNIYYSRLWEEISYQSDTEDMPVSYLSAGYQSVLWMIMDIAYRVALLNPELTVQGDARGIEGVVLIDEIDTHLHPRWQWKVVSALECAFPNIQFILATHSPIVISSCKSQKLILISEDQQIIYLQDAYGYSVQDVLNFRQGTLEKPKAIKTLSNQFDNALDMENYIEAESIIGQMEKILGKEHADVKAAREELELNRWDEE